jgi:hypothetical protein
MRWLRAPEAPFSLGDEVLIFYSFYEKVPRESFGRVSRLGLRRGHVGVTVEISPGVTLHDVPHDPEDLVRVTRLPEYR